MTKNGIMLTGLHIAQFLFSMYLSSTIGDLNKQVIEHKQVINNNHQSIIDLSNTLNINRKRGTDVPDDL